MLVAKCVSGSQAHCQLSVIPAKLGQHALRGDKLLFVIDNTLEPGDLPNGSQSHSADLPDPLRNFLSSARIPGRTAHE
jgi:hypothetical protein